MILQESLLTFMRYVLPVELVEYFDLVEVKEENQELHLFLEESDKKPEEFKDIQLFSNGFYQSSTIADFPLRDKNVRLHISRRRWVDSEGKSYSRQWDLTAEGTRYSKEFGETLKKLFGHLSDTGTIS